MAGTKFFDPMAGTKPPQAEFAERLMGLSGGLAIAAGLFAQATLPIKPAWLVVELGLGVLWLASWWGVRGGRSLAIIGATVLCVISIPVTGAMFILLTLFAQSNSGALVMLCDVIRLALALVIILLLWTTGSRRYFRYVRGGGALEPRPRRTLGRPHRDSSLSRAAAPPTDEDVRALSDFLQADGQAEYPESGLAEAALTEAAIRRFGRRPAKPQVARYAAEVVAGQDVPRADVWPDAAKKLLLAAISGRPARGIDPRVRRATSGALLTALAPSDHGDAAMAEEFLVAARDRAGRSPGWRHGMEPTAH